MQTDMLPHFTALKPPNSRHLGRGELSAIPRCPLNINGYMLRVIVFSISRGVSTIDTFPFRDIGKPKGTKGCM